jgi:hypothetical protein
MIRRIIQFLSAACVLLLAAGPALLRAQAASGMPGVEFSCLVWEPLSIAEVFYRDGKSYLPLKFSPGNRSQLYPLKESTGLEFYEKATGADGATTYKPVGKAPLVKGARRMLFLVDPVPNSTGLPLRIFGVNDALDVFPPGTFRFLNFSSAALQVKFAGQTNKLPAGEISVVKSNVSDKGGFLPFQIGDSDGKVVFETRLFSQPSGREMVFILTQIIPPEPPKPAGQQQADSP